MKTKNLVLEAYKDMPSFLPADELNKLRGSHRNVYVTEALDTEKVDILVNKKDGTIKIRVDDKGRGPEWKFWKDHFETTTGTNYLLQTCPIDTCIIRCSTSRSPKFLKVLGVVSVDPVTGSKKWVPFHMIKKFCESCNMSPMPVVYGGKMNYEHIRGLIDKPILGVKRDGIFVVPDSTPTVYIKVGVNVDEEALKPATTYSEATLNALSQEFAMRAFDEADFKRTVTTPDFVKQFALAKIRAAKENMLLAEYVQRGEVEAGATATNADSAMKFAVEDRALKLWNRYRS